MAAKGFISLVIGIVAFGAIVGGAFAGGMMVGKGQVEETPNSVANLVAPGANTNLSEDVVDRLAERTGRGGDATGQRGPGGGIAGNAINGTIESVGDGTITINTTQGPLTINVGADTAVRQTVEVGVEGLTAGMHVTTFGERSDDGSVSAATITVVPEGQSGAVGFAGRPG